MAERELDIDRAAAARQIIYGELGVDRAGQEADRLSRENMVWWEERQQTISETTPPSDAHLDALGEDIAMTIERNKQQNQFGGVIPRPEGLEEGSKEREDLELLEQPLI